MKASGVLLVALAAVAGAEKVGTHGSSMAKQILEMLQTMSDNLHQEGKDAKHTWALKKCECDESKEDLNKSIETKAENIATAEADKEAAQGKANVASQEVADSKAAIKKANEDIQKAEKARAKENTKFQKQKTELVALMSTLDQAIDDLATSGSFLQMSKINNGEWMSATRQLLEDVMPHMDEKQMTTAESFLQQPNKQMLEQVSLTLQGLRKQFAAQLEDETSQENMQAAAHDNWMQKTNEMKNFNQQLLMSAKKTLSNTDDRVDAANKVIDHEGLQALKDELAQTTKDCAFAERRYNEHSELRQAESAAVQEALTLLGSDDSKDLFNALDGHNARKDDDGATTKAFLQIKSTIRRIKIARAPQNAKATGSNSKLDKVISSIDKQIEELHQGDTDDKAWDEECRDLMKRLKEDLDDAHEKIVGLEQDISDSQDHLNECERGVESTAEHIAELKNHMSEMTTNYNQTTADYQAAVRDQTAALALLDKVVAALNKFYAADTRTEHKTSDAAVDYEDQQDKGQGVVKLLEGLQTEVTTRMNKEETDQVEASNEYTNTMADLTEFLHDEEHDNAHYTQEVAQTKAELEFENQMLEETQAQEAMLQKEKSDNTPRCHFIKSNLQTRLKHRGLERDGLSSAKDALSGVKN